jgi:mannose-6-phosphate isomerase-like protein (cupin superfamily)
MTGIGRAVGMKPGEGHTFHIGGDEITLKASKVNDADAFSLIEYSGAAQPGPPPHVHRAFEELWYILEGEVDMNIGGQVTRAGAGSVFLVPRGTPHTFQVVGPSRARWIGVFSPGRYVQLLEELGKIIPRDGPPDPSKIVALFAKYDTEIVQ